MNALEIDRLSVRYGAVRALEAVSLGVAPGQIVALLGPSGSGKSTLAAAALALLPEGAVESGTVRVDGVDLATLGEPELRDLRGGRVGMIFQEPATALNPALTIGAQVAEVLTRHRGLSRRESMAESVRLLASIGLALSPRRYPHSLSGGQRQRVCIAMAIAASPALLVADEPTASLDPRARDEIAALLKSLVRERNMGLLLVTHDRALAVQMADRIVALEDGRVVPNVPPVVPPVSPQTRAAGGEVLRLDNVTRLYRDGGTVIPALREVSLSLRRGETLALIGESGSGKSTLARLALGLDRPDAGTVRLGGEDWARVRGKALHAMRRRTQAVFQDPAASFDPRMTVGRIVAEPLHLLEERADRATLVAEALAQVGLPADAGDRLPQSFSGGQRQRIAIARALILRPDLIVLDEALSALDEALQSEMAALLLRLQERHGLAYLFIAHDMRLVRQMADRVAVLCAGRVVAEGTTEEVLG